MVCLSVDTKRVVPCTTREALIAMDFNLPVAASDPGEEQMVPVINYAASAVAAEVDRGAASRQRRAASAKAKAHAQDGLRQSTITDFFR